MTARENIAVGRIEDAARRPAGARRRPARAAPTNIIARLPGELEQMLGRRFEGGVDLSGGEWQKFALARAYMRDAQVLDPRRADRRARRRRRVRGLPPLRGTDRRPHGHPHLASLLHRAHVATGSWCIEGGIDPGARHAPATRRSRRALRQIVRNAGGELPMNPMDQASDRQRRRPLWGGPPGPRRTPRSGHCATGGRARAWAPAPLRPVFVVRCGGQSAMAIPAAAEW